jgi:hypothetical protein
MTNNETTSDQFGPQDPDGMVKCLHCGTKFKQKEMKFEQRKFSPFDLWYCVNESCSGAGLHWDILEEAR